MSSKEVNLLSISCKQYFYKLKAYSFLVHSLIIVQLIALLFSMGGVFNMSSGNGELSVSVKSYNSNIVIVFSLLWIMFIAVQLISRPYKKMEFPLVTNRLSGNLSNIGFLVTGCLFGGITSSLVGVLLRLITYFMFDRSQVVFNRFFLSDLLLGIFVAILYMLLFSALGYFIGVLAQLNVSFVIIIPAVILGVLRVYNDFSQSVFKFFAFEVSLIMFVLKVIITSTILFSFSIFLSNRKEVSK
ncbi:putative membrane protein [Desulfosporosinus sp. OT]|nr:putative membrane protein [Desulfosporosinus sp. OT]